mmetsp:Transcript_53031/g.105427  ORF Transcript_53031/g.105427 Transcript_53031/m.105427 type:complete len:387 (+) Transcript_53031:747-1907(+)
MRLLCAAVVRSPRLAAQGAHAAPPCHMSMSHRHMCTWRALANGATQARGARSAVSDRCPVLIGEALELVVLPCECGGIDDRVNGRLLRELRVEVSDVRLSANIGLVDGRVFLVKDFLEVDRGEEGVLLELLDVSRARTKPLERVTDEQQLDEPLDIVAEVGGAAELRFQDFLIHVIHVARVERWQASEHLEHERAERPPIHGLPVPNPLQDLGREVLGRPTEGARSVGCCYHLLGEPKVCQADVADLIQQDVFRLQVAVDHIEGMQVAEAEGDLRSVEAHTLDGESSLALESIEEFAARQVVEHHVKFALVLESEKHAREERMPDLLEDVRLCLCVLHLIAPDDGLLLEDLHSIDVGGVLLAHEHDLTETTLAEHLEQIKVLQSHL